MVRLVFRPYTQVWRSICTSESLQTSTRVSPGFVLPRHRSPSFGYQRICYRSTLAAGCCDLPGWKTSHHLLSLRPTSLDKTVRLAYMLDSLVRVSRRVECRPLLLWCEHFNQTCLLPLEVGSSCSHDLPQPAPTVHPVYALTYPLLGMKRSRCMDRMRDSAKRIAITPTIRASKRLHQTTAHSIVTTPINVA